MEWPGNRGVLRLDVLAAQRLATSVRSPLANSLLQPLTSAIFRSVVPVTVQVGPNTLLTGHGRGICIHPETRIGARCRIGDDVTLGGPFDLRGPVIDDDVEVCDGARLSGGIHVGAGAWIGPGGVVDADVPPGARIHGGSRPELFTGDEPGDAAPLPPTLIMQMRPDNALRIAEFTRSFNYGGTEVQLIELVRGLQRRHEVHVGCLFAKGNLVDTLAGLNARPREFPLGGKVLQAETARVISRIARWLREHQIDVVHVHDYSGTLVVVPAARLAGCKVIVGRLDMGHWYGPARRAVLAALTHAADHVIANAEAIRELLVHQERVPADRISVIHNGIDLPRFDARRAEGLVAPLPDVGDAPVITHVANMNDTPVKRQEDLLEALRLLRAEGTDCHVFFVGDGMRRPKLEALAAKLGVADRAHFLGHRSDVPAIYGRATAGVLCSSAEGLSNAIIEGMAAGLPMVVTRAGGNPELVAHGERGLVVPVQRPEELARALGIVLRDPELRWRLGARARAFVETELTLENLIRNHERVYTAVAGRESLPEKAVRLIRKVTASQNPGPVRPAATGADAASATSPVELR